MSGSENEVVDMDFTSTMHSPHTVLPVDSPEFRCKMTQLILALLQLLVQRRRTFSASGFPRPRPLARLRPGWR